MRTQPQEIIEQLEADNSRLAKEQVLLSAMEEGLDEIVEGWAEWKSGPMTEPSDVKPARKELLNYCMAFLKKHIK